MLADLLLLFIGLTVIYFGARWFVDSSASIAEARGISPFVVGVVVIGFGTSVPEFSLSILSGLENANSISLGNVIGSNVNNLTIVLFAGLLFCSLLVTLKQVRTEATFSVIALVLTLALASDGRLDLWDGMAMLTVFALFLWAILFRRPSFHPGQRVPMPFWEFNKRLGVLIIGLVLLVVGAQVTIFGAVGIARGLGVDEFIIGLTIVSLGTCLPETASSLIAARRNRFELALGNTFGSLVFNTLVVLGAGAVISNIVTPGPDLLGGFVPMLLMTLFFIALVHVRGKLTRVEGGVMMLTYFLFLAAALEIVS